MLEIFACAFNYTNNEILMLKLECNLIWNLGIENDIEKRREIIHIIKEKIYTNKYTLHTGTFNWAYNPSVKLNKIWI
jgi:hypothetical protein